MAQLDLSNEWKVFDNLETIVYTPRLSGQSMTIPNVLRRAPKKDILSGGEGQLFNEEVNFHVWFNQIPIPFWAQVADKFTDAEGLTWVVKKVDVDTFRTRFRLSVQLAK